VTIDRVNRGVKAGYAFLKPDCTKKADVKLIVNVRKVTNLKQDIIARSSLDTGDDNRDIDNRNLFWWVVIMTLKNSLLGSSIF
jgi:hypothetical protein